MGIYRNNNGGIWSRLSFFEGAKIRLECYEDLYKYNPTDKDVLENYSYWLNKLYCEFVPPSFYHHNSSTNGIKIWNFYNKNCWDAKCLIVA